MEEKSIHPLPQPMVFSRVGVLKTSDVYKLLKMLFIVFLCVF